MRSLRHVLHGVVAAAGFAILSHVGVAFAADPPAAPPAAPLPDSAKVAVQRGDPNAKCTRCHDESEEYPVLAIGKTRHGTRADNRAPACYDCHGQSDTHINKPEGATERPAPEVVFRGARRSGPEKMNGACLACHQADAKRSHWEGSQHWNAGVACVNCHQIHTQHDAVRDKLTQPDVCFTCHKEQRTQIQKPSRHPIPEGKMGCSDCHNPHGSVGPKLMKRDSVNETCYTCHMEKRGPFVHVHEPVAEDCSNCHNPHGTVVENLLKIRPPMLCHQCHTPHGAQVGQIAGQGQTSAQLSGITSGKSGINYFMARGCVNCHTQIHGTNNPSTTNPTPQFNFR